MELEQSEILIKYASLLEISSFKIQSTNKIQVLLIEVFSFFCLAFIAVVMNTFSHIVIK